MNATKRRFTSFERDAVKVIKLAFGGRDISSAMTIVATHFDRLNESEQEEFGKYMKDQFLPAVNKSLGTNVT